MSRSKRTFVIASSILCVLTSAAQAQTQAACTFTFFGLGVNIPNLGPGFIAPAGINDFRTIVGTAIPSNESAPRVAFVRWANGGFVFPLGTGGPSELVDRNDVGISIGDIGGVPILLNGTTVTDITLNTSDPGVQLQAVNRVNRWGSIAGNYFTDFPNGLTGLKRWSNGGFVTLIFPGGTLTTATGINDSGTVVGFYFFAQGQANAFIFHNSQWAKFSFPNSMVTAPVGISDAGVVIGNALMPDGTETPFLYQNGAFKIISVPNATANSTTVFGISPKLGLIVGTAGGIPKGGFIGKCS